MASPSSKAHIHPHYAPNAISPRVPQSFYRLVSPLLYHLCDSHDPHRVTHQLYSPDTPAEASQKLEVSTSPHHSMGILLLSLSRSHINYSRDYPQIHQTNRCLANVVSWTLHLARIVAWYMMNSIVIVALPCIVTLTVWDGKRAQRTLYDFCLAGLHWARRMMGYPKIYRE